YGRAQCTAVQTDGKILVGGWTQPCLFRLRTDGSSDSTFAPNLNGTVIGIRLIQGGDIVAFGYFSLANNFSVPGIARFKPDGALDTSFQPAISPPHSISDASSIENGKLLIA